MSERSRTLFCWQGWRLELPVRWSPVKLEGDYQAGYALFADLHRARLGLRWATPRGRRFKPEPWAQQAMVGEVGTLATKEARAVKMPTGEGGKELWQASLLYVEREPPGRDVWVARSIASGRTVEMVYHSRRGEHMLAEALVPSLADMPADQPMPWSVFELSCIVPTGLTLDGQQLNAGDLSLKFAGRRRSSLTVRQVAVAKLALQRLSLDKWLFQQQRAAGKHYRPAGRAAEEVVIEAAEDGRRLAGLKRASRRRWRFAWMRWLPAQVMTWALHDATRDRLVLLQSTDEDLLRQVAPTVGWARKEGGGAAAAERTTDTDV